MSDFGGLLAVFVLVVANGFFVAAEFSLVAVRRSRVMELVAAKRMNAKALEHALVLRRNCARLLGVRDILAEDRRVRVEALLVQAP